MQSFIELYKVLLEYRNSCQDNIKMYLYGIAGGCGLHSLLFVFHLIIAINSVYIL
jgi:hypothetical protein